MRWHHNLAEQKALPQMHGTLLGQSAPGLCTLALSIRHLQPPAHQPSLCSDHPKRLHEPAQPAHSWQIHPHPQTLAAKLEQHLHALLA